MKDHVLRFVNRESSQKIKIPEAETVEQYLSRGGVINRIAVGVSAYDTDLGMPKAIADKMRYSGIKGGKKSRKSVSSFTAPMKV